MIWLYVVGLLASFLVTGTLLKYWIPLAHERGIAWPDMNKYDLRKVAGAGGITVVAGLAVGLMVYAGLQVFLVGSTTNLINIFAILSFVLLVGLLGFAEDLLGTPLLQHGKKRKDIWWKKPLLTLPMALPIMIIAASQSTISLPFFGLVNVGLLYPLALVPIGIVGAANGYNMLAGLNGVEAGMGTLILSALGYAAWIQGNLWIAYIAAIAIFALLAFLVFNWYPAKVFPGDSLTYLVGGLIGIMAIMGNMELLAVVLFIPYLLEGLVVKARIRFKGVCFGIPQKDGTLRAPEKVESLTHLVMRFANTEKKVVMTFFAVELILISVVILLL